MLMNSKTSIRASTTSVSASIISTTSAYTLGSSVHPSIAFMASPIISTVEMCLHQCQRCGILCECDRRGCLRPFFSLFVHNCQTGQYNDHFNMRLDHKK